MSADLEPTDEIEAVPFVLDDEGAVHVARRLAGAMRRVARIERRAEAARREIDAEVDAAIDADRRTIEQLREQLAAFALNRLAASNGKVKSHNLIFGRVQTRTTDKWDWVDGDPLLGPALAGLGLARLVSTFAYDKREVKKAATVKDGVAIVDGEVLPGVTVTSVTTADFPGRRHRGDG